MLQSIRQINRRTRNNEHCVEVQLLTDCKGRAFREVQEKDSARVKDEVPWSVKGATIAQLVAFRH